MNNFYVYTYINPITNKIFYIGKGQGDRIYTKWNRNYLFRKEIKIIISFNKEPIGDK